MKFADIIFKKVNRFMEIFLVLIFGLLVLDVLWQVFSRYVLNTSFSWTEELARFSLIWLSILGAAYLNARREHLSMDFLYAKFSDANKKKVSILIEILILLKKIWLIMQKLIILIRLKILMRHLLVL